MYLGFGKHGGMNTLPLFFSPTQLHLAYPIELAEAP